MHLGLFEVMLTALNLTYMCEREGGRAFCCLRYMLTRLLLCLFDDEGQCSSSECWPLNADDGFIFCCLAPFARHKQPPHTSRKLSGSLTYK